jgi:hypothetical protein
MRRHAPVALWQVSPAPYVGRPVAEKKTGAERSAGSRPREVVPPRRGWARPYGGRALRLPAVPVFRGLTGQVAGLYPWLYGAGLPAAGAYLGVDFLTGGAFYCHPLEWLAAGLVSNPNVVVTGTPGVGKSATVKALDTAPRAGRHGA